MPAPRFSGGFAVSACLVVVICLQAVTFAAKPQPDVTPPSVSLTGPASGANVSGTITVTATATDDVGVSGVQFLLDGANLSSEDTRSPYSVSWNTATVSIGAHVLSARARDASGKQSTATSIAITVDNQAPTGTVVVNGGAAATSSVNVVLTLAATDAQGAVTQMRFSNSGTSYSTAEGYAPSKAWTLSSGSGTKTVYVQFKDAAGNWSAAATDTIVLDTTAPTISGISVSAITNSTALIRWTTSEPATSVVQYGTTTAYGQTAADSMLMTAHAVTLSGLTPVTTYNYRVRSVDGAGNERIGSNSTFKTIDSVAPTTPTNVTATATTPTQVSVTWTASTDNVAVTGYTVFRNGVQVGTPTTPSFTNTGLARATTFTYRVSARDAAGNVSPQSADATATTPALVLTNIATSAIASTSAVISWTTDVPATSRVEYGTTLAYGSSTVKDPALALTHSQTLTGLTPSTLYHVRVVSEDAASHSVSSSDVVLTTTAGAGNPPVPTITSPVAGAFFRAGDTIAFSGDATDAEDGVPPASAFSWAIDFLHDTHVHAGQPQVGIKSGTFTIPTTGHDFSGNTRYRITLTVTDTNAQQASQSVVIVPEKVVVSFATEPVGLSLTVDGGAPRVAPFDYDTLVGFNHTINAADQSLGQNGYTFASWSDGGARQHTLVVPASGASLTATFTAAESTLPVPSPVISRNVPVFASGQAYPATLANDADYETEWRSTSPVAWIAYDLSGVPTAQRQQILVAWHNNSGANYDFAVIPTQSNFVPGPYVIEGHTAAGGSTAPSSGWVTLATSPNPQNYHNNQHYISNFGSYNWLRFRTTGVNPVNNSSNVDVSINLDVHDVHLGAPDSWMFYGDSITANLWSPGAFSTLIKAGAPQFFPAASNGGIPFLTSTDVVPLFARWLPLFPGTYVGIAYGTNDASGITPAQFYTNMRSLVDQVLAAGKIPVIPTIPWASSTQRNDASIRALNDQIALLIANYAGQIRNGPDVYTAFLNRNDLLQDGLHPNDAGTAVMRQAWAIKMLTIIYGQPPAP